MSGLADELPTFCPECLRGYPVNRKTGKIVSRTCSRRTCPLYAPKYLRDQAERLRAGLAEWDGETTIATITAPGVDQLPWDPALCKIQGPHKHSGPAGCSVNPWTAARYNAGVCRLLGALLNHARVRAQRAGVRRTKQPRLLAYALEIKRGVFHVHLIFGYTWAQRAALDVLLDQVDDLRGEYGFGTAAGGFDRGKPGKFSGAHAGLYAAKYLRPDGAKGSFIPALEKIEASTPRNPDTGRRVTQVRPVFVSPTLTSKSGVTMRFLRWSRYAYIVWGRVEVPRAELLAVYRLVREFGAELLEFAPTQPQPPPRGGPENGLGGVNDAA